MSRCEPDRAPPRRVMVRVEAGAEPPAELRRVVPEKLLAGLAARASRVQHGKRRKGTAGLRPVDELVDDLRASYAVVVPAGADPRAFTEEIGRWKGASSVYLEPELALPPATKRPTDDRAEKAALEQRLPAPVKGADGAGVSFVDVEWGWAEHEALPRIETVYGVSRGWWWHGNATLGVIVGRTAQARGLAPRARGAFASPWRKDGTYEVARALAAAASHLDAGDVLLVELQASCGESRGLPVEVDPVVADVIALATHAGVITVEAAGNGGHHLDEVCVSGRGRGSLGSSGAVLVGAMVPGTTTRSESSGWGKAVLACGPGDDVATAWSNHVGTSTSVYTTAYSGTSAAAAVVAGVAIAVQSASRAKGRTLLPAEMQEVLRRGTPIAGVGVLPDLAGIVANL